MRYATLGQIVLKCMFIAVCTVMTFGLGYPPSKAQVSRQHSEIIPVLTVEDAVQDKDILAINKHLEATDTRVEKFAADVNKVAVDVSGMQGENRIAYGVLGMIATTSLVVTVRKKAA